MNFESFEDIKVLMDNFDPAALLPDLTGVAGMVSFLTRIALLAGPIVLLALGVAYFLAAPREANYHFGYRCFFGMGSEEAWQFTQRLAGIVWAALGLVLTVVMLFITGGFGSRDVIEVVGTGVKCLLWEAGLTALSCFAINVTVAVRYDRRGNRREM